MRVLGSTVLVLEAIVVFLAALVAAGTGAVDGMGRSLLIGGLLARGTEPRVAAGWGVWLHGEAGRRLAERIGPLGFLARELLSEIPSLMAVRR